MGSGPGRDQVSATATIAEGVASTSGNLKAGSYRQRVSTDNLSGSDVSNYIVSYTTNERNYMVSKLGLTTTIADGGNVYGDAIMPGAVTLAGVLGSGTSRDQVSGTATIANPDLSPSGHLNVGSYRQSLESGNLSGDDASNYSISYTTGMANYTVTAKVINLDGVKPYDGDVNFDASFFGDDGVIGAVGNEMLKLIGTGTVASPEIADGRQRLHLGNLTLTDGENGGLATNYTLEGGTHFGTIINNPSNIPPQQPDSDSDSPLKRRKFDSTSPDDPVVTADNYNLPHSDLL